MNEQPKTKFYKRWWFVLPVGMVLGVAVILILAVSKTYPQYLSPSYWINKANQPPPAVPAYFELREKDTNGNFVSTGLDSRYLVNAGYGESFKTNAHFTTLLFNEQGKQILREITARNIGKVVGFFVNGNLMYTPTVSEEISGGSVQIGGENMSSQEAAALARNLDAGKKLTTITPRQ